MRGPGKLYPLRDSCVKTGLRFEVGTVKSLPWRDKSFCKSVDGRKSSYVGSG